jgi:hypothetical protein
MSRQLTNQIMMIRPANFGYNPETAVNNAFQSTESVSDAQALVEIAKGEFDAMVTLLRSKGVNVTVIEDTLSPIKPDAVFPNNWVSFHDNGFVITYPMFAKNRRIERRDDILDTVGQKFTINKRYSFEFYEDEDNIFLEGTGSMIFDRPNKIVYACLSQRTDPTLIDKFNVLMGTTSVVFGSVDRHGAPIYHTNVMMALGQDFVVICMDSIPNEESKEKLRKSFESTNKHIVEISFSQMEAFGGNMLEVLGEQGKRYLVMSQSSYDVLTADQIKTLEQFTTLLPVSIPNIEKFGGGSVRCMMAEIFLPPKQK